MAELKGLGRQGFLDLFLPAYNRVHLTDYAGEPDHLPHQEWDYRWRGSKPGTPPLLVQHTRAGSNEEEERRKPAMTGRWTHEEIQAPLLSAGLKGCQINVWVHCLPTSLAERREMGIAIRERALSSLISPPRVGEIRTLAPINERGGLAELEVEGASADHFSVSVRGPGFEFDDNKVAARGLEALRKKQARIGPRETDVVLAIFFDLTPYNDADAEQSRADLRAEKIYFREVWVVSPFGPDERADRVWPS